MKRVFFVAFMFLFLITFTNATEMDDSKVDNEVFEELVNDGKVEVVVVLKEEIETGFGLMAEVEGGDVVEDLNLDVEAEYDSVNAFSGEVDSTELNDLLEDDRVEKVYFKKIYKTFLVDSVPLINASVVHNLNYGLGNIKGQGQTICILDTGINYTHVDFGGCTSDEFLNGTCNKVVGGHDFYTNDSDPYDDQGHGTHVAGIAAGNGTLVGVAPDAQIVAVKVCDGNATSSCGYVQQGFDWCVTNSDVYNITVISMSLGSGAYSSACDGDSLVPFVNAAVDKNITVIAATGNSGSSSNIASPACITNVTAVSSTDKSDGISSFSDRNSLVDLFAPGTGINATTYDGSYGLKSGTSMAAPHAAGIFALLRNYYEDISLDVNASIMLQQLKETGKKIYDSSSSLTIPRVDIYNAINDTAFPRIEFGLDNETIEYNQDNFTINVTFFDAFLDVSSANISYPNGSLLSTFTDEVNLTTVELNEFGNYSIKAWANDTAGNLNSTFVSFLVKDSNAIGSFVFNSVDDNNYTDVNLVEFNITFEGKYNLSNATLYHNFTSWHANETLDINGGNESSLVFNSTFNEGSNLWYVETCDIYNHCDGSSNKTLFVDQSTPIVNLTGPSNSSSLTKNPVVFSFNVSDLQINNCDLHLNGTLNSTITTVNLTGVSNFEGIIVPDGDYNWSVGCTDKVSNNINTTNFEFSIACSSESTFTRDCTSYSACMGDKKTKLCYDSNFCTNDAQNISTTFSSCSSSSDDSSSSSSSSSSSGSSGDSDEGSNDVTSSFKFNVKAGDNKKISISKDVGISGLDLKFKRAVDNVDIKVTKQDSQPSSVSAVSNIYKYLKISTNLFEEDLEEAKIEFSVPKTWININALGRSTNVFLSRFKDGKWDKLETLTAGDDGLNQKYIATSPGFSFFAISANKDVSTVPDIVTTDGVVNETNETVNETVDGPIEEVEESTQTIFGAFTGAVTDAVSNLNSTYSLIGLGVLVFLLIGFLYLRFKKKISRIEGVKIKNHRFAKLRWLLSFGLLRILKRGDGKVIGKWEDVPRTELDVGVLEPKKIIAAPEDKPKTKRFEVKEYKEKKGFFKRLFSRKRKVEEKPKEESSKKKKSFFKRLFSRKRKVEEKPKEESSKKKKGFFKRLFKRKKKSEPTEIKMENEKKVEIKKRGFFKRLFSRKKKVEEKPKEESSEKKKGFFSKLKNKFKKNKTGHDFEIK